MSEVIEIEHIALQEINGLKSYEEKAAHTIAVPPSVTELFLDMLPLLWPCPAYFCFPAGTPWPLGATQDSTCSFPGGPLPFSSSLLSILPP